MTTEEAEAQNPSHTKTKPTFKLFLAVSPSGFHVLTEMGQKVQSIYKEATNPPGDLNAKILGTIKIGLLWTERELKNVHVTKDRYNLVIVTRSNDIATVLKAGRARSVVLSRLIKEIVQEVGRYASWSVEVKEKGTNNAG